MKLYVTVIMSVYQILHTNKMSEYKAIMSEYGYSRKSTYFQAFSGTGGEPGAGRRAYNMTL